jgi:hypothetical protein
MSSRYFNYRQLRGVAKVGDILIPGDVDLPSFSEAQLIHHVDRFAGYLPEDDRDDFCMLMGIFALLPSPLLRMVLKLTDYADHFPDLLAAPLRMVSLAVKGMFFSVYYSDLDEPKNRKTILNSIQWSTSVDISKGERVLDRTKMKNLESPQVEDIALVFEDAKKAQVELRALPLKRRAEMVEKLKDVILNSVDSIIDRIQQDTKKSKTDAIASEIIGTLDYLGFLAKEGPKALKDRSVKTPLMLLGKKIGHLVRAGWDHVDYFPLELSLLSGHRSNRYFIYEWECHTL